jgi:hypothetical protein
MALGFSLGTSVSATDHHSIKTITPPWSVRQAWPAGTLSQSVRSLGASSCMTKTKVFSMENMSNTVKELSVMLVRFDERSMGYQNTCPSWFYRVVISSETYFHKYTNFAVRLLALLLRIREARVWICPRYRISWQTIFVILSVTPWNRSLRLPWRHIHLVNHNHSVICYLLLNNLNKSRGSSGATVSDYWLADRGSIPDRARGFFLQPLRPDRLWSPPSLLSNGYRGSFPRG